jgi:hypothetical protein
MSYQPSSGSGNGTSSLAVVSLVSGILAWCALPLVGAIVAIVCGHLARGEIRRSPIDRPVEGDGLAVAGLVLGYAQLVMVILALLVFVALLIFGFSWWNWH